MGTPATFLKRISSGLGVIMKRSTAWILGLGLLVGIAGSREAASLPAQSVGSLVSYWKLDETTGTTSVDSIAGNNGNFSPNPPTIVTAGLPPALQFANPACLDFEESLATAVIVPDSPETSLTGDFTLSAWINPESYPGHQQGIIEKWFWNGSTAEDGYMLRLGNSMTLKCSIAGPAPGGTNGGSGSTAIPTGTWTHVAATFDTLTGNIQIYVNGTLDGTGSSPILPPDGGANLEIGRAMGANEFDGLIDDVRIYDYALLSGDIQQLAAGVDVGGGSPPPPPPPPSPPPPPGPASNREGREDDCGCSTIKARPISGWLALIGLGLAVLVRRVNR